MATENKDMITFSDDEEEGLISSWRDAAKFKMPFGKHRNKTLAVMISTEDTRSYLRYIMNWEDLRDNSKSAITCALEHYQDLKDSRRNRGD